MDFSLRANIEFFIGVAVHKRGVSAGRTTAGFSIFNFYLRTIYIQIATAYSVYEEIGQHGDVIDLVAVKIAHHHVYAQLIKSVVKGCVSASTHDVTFCPFVRGTSNSGVI